MTHAAQAAPPRAAAVRPHPRFRGVELFLLCFGAAIAVAAPVPLFLVDHGAVTAHDILRPLALVSAFLAVHVALSLTGSASDEVLLPAVLVLMALAMALSQRLAPALDERQFGWLLVGVVTLAAAALGVVPLRLLRRYRYTCAAAGVALVAATLVFGRGVGDGPRLWLGVGPLQFQPSEVLKLLLVIYLAGYLADRQHLVSVTAGRVGRVRLPPVPYLAPLGVMLGASLLLLAVQRDLGAALLLYVTGLGMLYIASGRASYVLAGGAAFAAGAFVLYRFLPLVEVRAAIWRDPWSDASGFGYQLVQALMAMGAGGLVGTGLGLGQPGLIPAVHTDFVYAAVAEELGLAGAAAVIGLYGVILWRGWRIALDTPSLYAGLLASGLTLSLAVQALVIIGGIVRAVPLTGITLPFLSHGGTSLVTSAAAVGLLLLVSHESRVRAAE